jgi:L-fucose isomerase
MHNNHNNLSPMPKVGIRPVIDARLGGVRESLEKATMDMAKRVQN